jgi:hypothetical protein
MWLILWLVSLPCRYATDDTAVSPSNCMEGFHGKFLACLIQKNLEFIFFALNLKVFLTVECR